MGPTSVSIADAAPFNPLLCSSAMEPGALTATVTARGEYTDAELAKALIIEDRAARSFVYDCDIDVIDASTLVISWPSKPVYPADADELAGLRGRHPAAAPGALPGLPVRHALARVAGAPP